LTPVTHDRGNVTSVVEMRIRKESTNKIDLYPSRKPSLAQLQNDLIQPEDQQPATSLSEIQKFNKDANLLAMNIFEIQETAKCLRKAHEPIQQNGYLQEKVEAIGENQKISLNELEAASRTLDELNLLAA
jgi:NADH dehydrogenase/NADH:ubiquinone oxidoreductase subunit G